MEKSRSFAVLIIIAGIVLFVLGFSFRQHQESVNTLIFWSVKIVFILAYYRLCSLFESQTEEQLGEFRSVVIFFAATLVPGISIILLHKFGPVPFLPW